MAKETKFRPGNPAILRRGSNQAILTAGSPGNQGTPLV
jgi:hypothetical protein